MSFLALPWDDSSFLRRSLCFWLQFPSALEVAGSAAERISIPKMKFEGFEYISINYLVHST